MGLFGNHFRKDAESVALIDIGSGSVGGALLYTDAQGPALEYTIRVPIEPRGEESIAFAMLRALEKVASELTVAGAPLLRQKTGSGSVGSILVSVASPWQDTLVRTERLKENEPFTLTRSLMRAAVEKTAKTSPDRIGSGETVIATILNGYQTNEPFGKRVKLADIIVLSSTIDATVSESIETTLRAAFHTHHISLVAFPPLAYAVFRDAFPHEKQYLVIDASGEATDIALIEEGLLASVISVPSGTRALLHPTKTAARTSAPGKGVRVTRSSDIVIADDGARAKWVTMMIEALKGLSNEHALPRSVFLLADDAARDYVKTALDDEAFRSLWLSSDPISIVPILPAQFSSYVRVEGGATGDPYLMMLALYHGKRIDRFVA